MASSGAATAVTSGRGNRTSDDAKEYPFILPQLPKGRVAINTVFLHGDVRARPYKVEDFRDALLPTGLLPDVACIGAYQINHVWAVTLKDATATKRLVDLKELQVKGRRCVIVDPQDQQVKLRLHWLLYGVADEDVRTAFAAFGKVEEVSRERWRVHGMGDKTSTTRTVLLKLKSGVKVEDLPHQVRVGGELALVVVPGRPMQCLRCQGTGHVRRECKVPRCSRCRRFGHVDDDCVKSYAAATGPAVTDVVAEHVMDVVEAEDAAEGAGSLVTTATSSGTSTGGAEDKVADAAEKPREHVQVETAEGQVTGGGGEGAPDDNTVAMQQDEAVNDGDRPATPGGPVKRPHDESNRDEGAGSTSEGPPTKTPLGRRMGFKPKPNVPTEKKPGDNAPPTNNAGKPQGPGGG
ncbi:uncharacterized protein LOC125945095 [Dermacentor silvarum]|uniref:uncharacterized protein LOC125945095 n=1 Tax=Dermacentor silvarum TaxID=543639 RepID=UPI0021016C94|nr:uncharacterized protein LOC125945095 [Dermacentor silvarum]